MKSIDVIVSSHRKELFDVVRPVSSADLMPEWWKSLPHGGELDTATLQTSKTMKTCKGLTDLYRNSITVPLWTDINIEVGARGDDVFRWSAADANTNLEWHTDSQKGSFLPGRDFCNVRIRTPWKVSSKQPLNMLYTNAGWSMANPFDFFVPNGVVDTSQTKTTNVMFMVERKPAAHVLELKLGDAMAQYVPLTDKKINLIYELVSEDDFNAMDLPHLSFNQTYYKVQKMKNLFFRNRRG